MNFLWKLIAKLSEITVPGDRRGITQSPITNNIGGSKDMTDSKARLDRELDARFPHYARTRKNACAEAQTGENEPRLEMKWIIVSENGKRQLRMQWSVPANSGAGRQGFQKNAGNRASKRQGAVGDIEAFEQSA